jgi:hypothetical protein
MWLVPSHLTFVRFFDLLGDRLELFLELCCLCLHLHGLLLECVYYLDCNFITDQSMHSSWVCAISVLASSAYAMTSATVLLEWFHLSLTLLFLCLHSGEFCLQFLHILCPFDALCDGHCLLPLLEVLDSCAYPFFFLVPLWTC